MASASRLPELSEHDAGPEIKAIYGEIKACCRVPMVALIYRHLATLVRDAPEVGPVDGWRWTGPRENFEEICDYLDSPRLPERAQRLAEGR